jgi:dipeptidyl aminopeptidase/acylaminoacyl peptidase
MEIRQLAALGGLVLALHMASALAAPDAGLFAAMPETAAAEISPDGRYLAAKTYLKGQYMLVIYDLDNIGKVKPVLASPKDMEVSWLRWKSKDRLLVSLYYPDRRWGTATIETRLFALNPDGSNLKFLVPPRQLGKTEESKEIPVQIADRVVDFLPDDPKHILMQFNPEDPGLPRIYRVDVYTAQRVVVEGGEPNVVQWITDQQGRPRLGYALDNQNMLEQFIYRAPDQKKWEVLKTRRLDEEEFWPELFDRDNPDIAWVRSNHEGATTGLYRYQFSTRSFVEKLFLHPTVDIGSVITDAEGRRIVGVSYNEAESKVKWFDPQVAAVFADVHLRVAAKHVYVASWSQDYRRMVLFGESPDLPGRYYLYDTGSKDLRLFAFQYPELDKMPMAPMRATSYKARDGLIIPGYLSLPAGQGAKPAKPLPAIIMPHGGPGARDYSSFDPLVQLFTSRGYAVLQMNFRGSTGYGAEFRGAGDREWGKAMQDDITDGTRWLAEEGIADPKRTCIVGWSYGGYAALMGGVKEPELYACVASIAGVSDLRELISSKRNYVNGRISTRRIGDFWTDRKSLEENSPVNGAARFRAPVFLAHGTRDRVVNPRQSTDMAAALKRAGKDYQYVELKDADHSVLRGPERLQLFTALDAFVSRSLGAP